MTRTASNLTRRLTSCPIGQSYTVPHSFRVRTPDGKREQRTREVYVERDVPLCVAKAFRQAERRKAAGRWSNLEGLAL